jgi:hypothetical protein
VTRLGENSPNGWLFALGSLMKILQKYKFLGNFLPRVRLNINFDKNVLCYILGDIFHKLIWSPWCWATFWEILSQTHLVALAIGNFVYIVQLLKITGVAHIMGYLFPR